MSRIKRILLLLLGREAYLSLVSRIFFLSYRMGWLRSNPAYYTHYLAAKLVQPGNTVIDIGANLGYYTRIFASRVGSQGKVLSVEPINTYRKILAANTARLPQVNILPYALGESEGILRMGQPGHDAHRHGLMRVIREGETAEGEVYEVPVKHPLALFGELPAIHYVKCDIEGYEVPVIPAMEPLLHRHRPIVQVETAGDNLVQLMRLFQGMDYETWYAGAGTLIPYKDPREPLPGDLIAIPRAEMRRYQHLMAHAAT